MKTDRTLDFDVQADFSGGPGKEFIERRDLLSGKAAGEPRSGIESPDQRKRRPGNPFGNSAGPFQGQIVHDDPAFFGCQLDIELDDIRFSPDSLLEGGKGIFRRISGRSAMSEYENLFRNLPERGAHRCLEAKGSGQGQAAGIQKIEGHGRKGVDKSVLIPLFLKGMEFTAPGAVKR